TLFEQAKEIKGIGAGFGLAANDMQALEYIGIREEVEKIGYYLDSFAILDQKGNILVNPNTSKLSDKYAQKNYAIHRADLHLYVLAKVDQDLFAGGKRENQLTHKEGDAEIQVQDVSLHRINSPIISEGAQSPRRGPLLPSIDPRYAGASSWRATTHN